jgi:hypothetical protein
MIILGEKLGGGPVDHSAGLGVMSGALFLESSKIRPMLLMASERGNVRGLLAGNVCGAYVDWHEKRTCRVYHVFPAGCTSIRITVTLRYEYPLVPW